MEHDQYNFKFFIIPKSMLKICLIAALLGFTGASTVPPVSGTISKLYGAASLAALFGFVFFVHHIIVFSTHYFVEYVLILQAAIK